MKKYNMFSTSGTFNGVTAGSAVAGTALFLGESFQKVASLSALVTVLAETNTLTLAAKWQVSQDNSTWYDVANGSQNASAVVLGTGTAGADTAVSKVIPAPDAIYGWKYARISTVVGVATGAVGDTYAYAYNYHQLTGAEGKL